MKVTQVMMLVGGTTVDLGQRFKIRFSIVEKLTVQQMQPDHYSKRMFIKKTLKSEQPRPILSGVPSLILQNTKLMYITITQLVMSGRWKVLLISKTIMRPSKFLAIWKSNIRKTCSNWNFTRLWIIIRISKECSLVPQQIHKSTTDIKHSSVNNRFPSVLRLSTKDMK